MSAPAEQPTSTLGAFLAGFVATWTSVFSYVLFGTYTGIGAVAHDFGFSVTWALASTLLVWAGPAQVILISTLGAGASLIEAAIAVGLSSGCCQWSSPCCRCYEGRARGPGTCCCPRILPR